MLWQAQKMKVNIAAQTLSSSVADAIDFCRQELQLDQFKDSEATTRFIRMFDRLFDMFNSRNPFCCNYKAPLRVSNELFWTQFLEEAYMYIEGLRDISGGLICSGRKKEDWFPGLPLRDQECQGNFPRSSCLQQCET